VHVHAEGGVSRLVDKIRKLLTLADNDGANPNEADVARSMAERLMSAAGLTEDDIADGPRVNPASTVGESTTPAEDPWMHIVATSVGRVTGCRVFTSIRPARREPCAGCERVAGQHDHFYEAGLSVVWVGSANQRAIAVELFTWVEAQVERLAAGARASAKGNRGWLKSYRLGVASAIAGQARGMVEHRDRVALVGNALVMRDETNAAITLWMSRYTLGKGRVVRASGSGFASGKHDGGSVGLRRSVGAASTKRLGSGS
jgi:hypothetical protein